MKRDKSKLTLDRPATYQIKVPGQLNDSWKDRAERITFEVESKGNSLPVTTLTCVVDQAGLHGLLRRLYSFGLPLISVVCLEGDDEDEK